MSLIKPLTIAGRTFAWGNRTYLMGILNITPDSFSGDGLMASANGTEDSVQKGMVQVAMAQARRFGNNVRPGLQFEH